jgi:HK97 family phage prohead protease
MKVKQRMRLEIKEITAEGSFEGLLSPYGNVDGGGDVVEPGAFTKTLQEQGNTRPMLWQHKQDVPIGDLTLEDRPDGLYCKGQLLMALPEAQKAYLLMKAKIVKGLSIGFEALKDAVTNGVRHLKEIKLYEGSVVTFPMNENALITSVKGRSEVKGDFNEELTEIQLGDAGYQMRCALQCALSSCTWADMTREEKIAAAAVVIQQFTDAYMAYYPAYLDMLSEMYGGMETWHAKQFETKAGKKISAATKESIKSACDHTKSAQDLLLALIADEAGEEDSTTSKAGAARETKTEPVDHSALSSTLDELKGALAWTLSNKN